jgi:hypothetical protein
MTAERKPPGQTPERISFFTGAIVHRRRRAVPA